MTALLKEGKERCLQVTSPLSCLDRCPKLVGGAVEEAFTLGHHHDPLGVPLRFLDVMGREGNRRAAADQVQDELPQPVPLSGIKPDTRLVEEQNRGAGHQTDRDVDPLLIATREGPGPVIGSLRETGEFQHPCDHRLGLLDGLTGIVLKPGEEHEVLADAEPAVERRLLRDPGDSLSFYGARIGFRYSGEDRKESRLAGPVRSDQCDHFTRSYREIDSVQCQATGERLADGPGREGAACGWRVHPANLTACVPVPPTPSGQQMVGRGSSLGFMNLLFIGDVVGSPGRRGLEKVMPLLRERHSPDVIVVNGENSAGGLGITEKTAREIFECGADVITLGNHTYRQRDSWEYLDRAERVIRPANYRRANPGKGHCVIEVHPADRSGSRKVAVINLIGMIGLDAARSPFDEADLLLDDLDRAGVETVIVDFHGEVTSEKVAMGWYLDGRVTAVFGTHTHVPTADGRVLPGGTAFICDVGMTGARDSVLGVKKEQAIEKMRTNMPVRFESATEDVWVMGAAIGIDESGRATDFKQVLEPVS